MEEVYFGMYFDKQCCLKFMIKEYVIINCGLFVFSFWFSFCCQIYCTFKFIKSDSCNI